MPDWIKRHYVPMLLLVISIIFTTGYVKAQFEYRVTHLETKTSSMHEVVHKLELTTAKLETIVHRLERLR